jgi:hypothetical protein
MRHLTVDFALGALRRGRGIQQLLGTVCVAGRPTLRWLTARRERDGGYVLTIHHVFDEGSEQFWDVEEFTPVDEDRYLGEGRSLGAFNTPEEVLDAAPAYGAVTTRWVNQGVIDDEYGELRNAQESNPPGVDPDPGRGADPPSMDMPVPRSPLHHPEPPTGAGS